MTFIGFDGRWFTMNTASAGLRVWLSEREPIITAAVAVIAAGIALVWL